LSARHQFRILVILVVIAVLLAALIWAAGRLFHAVPAAPAADPPGTFRPTAEQLHAMSIMRVESSSLGTLTTATGTVVADGDLSTPVFLPYSGQVTRVLVDTGRVVVKGQPLLMVRGGDFADARSAFVAAQAGYRASVAQLDNARRIVDRQQKVAETAGGAQKDYQQAQTDLAAAEAQERSAAAALTAAREKLAALGGDAAQSVDATAHEGMILRAPISGVIATREVSPGQYVEAGGDTPVLTITDTSRVWLVAQLAESEAGAVHIGDKVEVTTPAWPGRIFHAVIDTVGVGLDPATHRLPVRATIANADAALKPQMFANFSIRHAVANDANRIYVPAVAVIHEGDSARVWVLRDDGLLTARTVTTGERQNDQLEIIDGLKQGEKIVTAGALFVNEAGLGE
jgi:cobalt-zinc-cadmium efflux system membrane fusion protein